MSNEDEWELSKENVKPIRQGRHLSNLSAGLQLSEDQSSQLRKEKQQFEAELRTYSGDDPLEVWHRYLIWTEQNCVKGGKENNLEKLLENYLRQFTEETRYHNDPRYVSAWIRYVNMCKKPADLFSYMYDQKIGNELACFYESWAWVLEQMGNTKQANMIYQEGIKRQAEPVDILERKYSNFQMRVARGLAGKVMDDAPEETLEQRAALGQLKTTGKKNTVPVDRINAAKPLKPRGLGLQPLKPAQVGQNFMVYNDENQDPILPGQQGDWSDVPTRAVINKENEKKAGVWTKAKVPCKAVAPPSTPSFSLYVEENADQPMTTPRKLPEVGNQVLSARKPSKPVDNLQNFKHEQSDPNQKPMYAKDKVYCGAEEYSFEEIRAAKWFAKKKREEEKRRMEEDQKLIDEQREQLKRNQLLLQQEAEQFRLRQQSLQEEHQVILEQCRSEIQRQQDEFKKEREIMMQRQKEILEKEIEERMTAGLATSMENSFKQFHKDVQSKSINESQTVTKSSPQNSLYKPQKSYIQTNPSLSILQNENENACKSSLVEKCSQMSLSQGVQQNNSSLFKPSKTGSSQLSLSNISRIDVENVTPNNRSFGMNNSGGRLTNSNSGGRKISSGPSPTVNTKQAMQLVTGMFNASLAIEANLGWDGDEDDMVTAPPQAVQPVASNAPFTVFNDEEMDVGQASNKENDENRFSKSTEFVAQRKKGLSRGGLQPLSKDNFENMEYEGKLESIESQARDDYTICPIGTNQSFAAAARIASTPFNRDKPLDSFTDVSSIEPSDAKSSLQIYTSTSSRFHTSKEEIQDLSPIMEGSNEEGSDHHGQSNGLIMSHTQNSQHHAMETESLLAAPKYEDLNQSSHVIDTTQYIPSPSVRLQLGSRNPFDEKDIEKHLKSLSKPLNSRPNYVQRDEIMRDIVIGYIINLGNDTYIAEKIIGKGGNAKVYMVSIYGFCDDRPENMALKVQSPACPWEFYICSELHDRLTQLNSAVDVRPAMMCARNGYFFNNCSCILTDYHAQGTLLDFVNDNFMKTNTSVGEPMAMYVTIEMLYMIETLHKCQIIHGDVKPDNFLFIGLPKLKESTDPLTVFGGSNRCMQLIDFGQSIDMSKYPKGTTFRAKVKTSGFQCIEMQTDRPWTYQTDLFGLVGTVHVLLFKKYMQIYQSHGEWKITSSFMRSWNVPLWKKLFHSCLNIPDCNQIPDISEIRREFEEYFVKDLLDKYSTILPSNV